MTKIAVIAVIIAVVAVGAFFAFRNSVSPANVSDGVNSQNSKPEFNLPSKPWLEVIKPKVFKVEAENRETELKTGDELENGVTIRVDRLGLGAAHLPDGSVLRVDSDSKFTLEETNFDPQSEKLTSKVTLKSGRIWSKILALVTPDSFWEVKTTNAVATVRGTAFGLAFVGGRSHILGSENTITVNPVDPATGNIIKEAETTLAADKYVEIKNEDVPKFIQNPKLLTSRDAPAELLNQEWVKRYKKEDREYNQRLDDLRRESGLEGRELRDLFRQRIFEEWHSAINRIEESAATPAPAATATLTASPPSAGNPEKIEVIPGASLANITEGSQIIFRAVVTMSDGKKRDVTNESSWRVVGPVGRIVKPGVFEAKLDESVAELGQASGIVIATWQDKASGENFLGQTTIFSVGAKVVEPVEREG